jgi:DNA repair protein RadA/Sms
MSLFRCSACGETTNSRFSCDRCGESGPFAAVTAESRPRASGSGPNREAVAAGTVVRLDAVSTDDRRRVPTGIEEFDRVCGGGLVKGSLVLVAGEPGSGKSTLLLQALAALAARTGEPVLYVSGEESAGQIRLRAERLGLDLSALPVLAETDVNVVTVTLETTRPSFAVIDSVQTLATGPDAYAGTPAQVRNVTQMLLRTAKAIGTTLLLVGHVNKDNEVAGPMTLAHLVDAVMLLEGDRNGFFRVLRASKNRFGAIDEIGLFEMEEDGMHSVPAPNPLHLEGGAAFGRAICPVLEGSRPLLVEVQALVSKAAYGNARRVALGVPDKRVAMLLAVLERYTDIDLSSNDVYVQVSSGINVSEPGIDAAICAAIASSYWSTPIAPQTAVVGEIGLGGEVRPVRAMVSRSKEAGRQGFSRLVGPGARGSGPDTVSDLAGLLATIGVLHPTGATAAKKSPPRYVFERRGPGPGDEGGAED